MGTYKKYIDDLEIQKNNLVTTLNNKGVEATNTETLNTLVPKVANIEGAKEEQEKTASASPNGVVIVTPDTGKALSKVTINAIPTTTQATPTIAVSSGGLIAVTSKQTEGYVKAGTKTPIKQLDVQNAKTITPSTSSQTAVSAYKFTTGAITVAGDANLTAANIKAGTKIFGITGTHAGQKTEQTKTVALSMASGNQTVTPDSGKVLNKVIVNKPSTLIPANVKKDVNIGGVVGTLESGGGDTSETWILNKTNIENINEDIIQSWIVPQFISNGISYTGFTIQLVGRFIYGFYYVNSNTSTQAMNLSLANLDYSFMNWCNEIYRKITFVTPPTGALLTWLQANGVKQDSTLVIQDTKSVIITENGTTEITPDVPYDVVKKVNVTTNVSGSSSSNNGFSITFPTTVVNWNKAQNPSLLLADGTTKPIDNYSSISGQTIKNVVGIRCFSTNGYFVLKMTLSKGIIAQEQMTGGYNSTFKITTSPNATMTPYGSGNGNFWWPLSDTVISSIEMYNTD